MSSRLRHAYARLRAVPIAGGFASRLVWAVKGALGRPLATHASRSAPSPPSVRRADPPAVDARLQVALAAVQALSERVAALEAMPEPPAMVRSTVDARCPASVSVIVSTLDRAAWLDRALSALAYQRHPAFEVIVVAGPCRDATADVLARHALRVRNARCAHANLAASRNLGLRMAQGDLVAFLDDDAVPEPDWLERLGAAFLDPQVGGAGGFIRDHTGIDHQCKVVVADRFGRSQEVSEVRRARVDPPGPAVQRYLSLTGTNCAFRRRALLDIGGFDEAFAYFLDETDVCLRLAEAGWRLSVTPGAEVHHAYAPSAQRRADRAPLSQLACVRSTAYFATHNAAPRHGLPAVANHLQAYAADLRRDTLWRRDHAVVSEDDAAQLLGEIETGLAEGVRAALSAPRKLCVRGTAADDLFRPIGAPPVIRRSSDRLSLCLLSQDFPSADRSDRPAGGVAVWTQAFAGALAAKGHEVTVITRAGADRPTVQFEAEGGAGVWLHRIAHRPSTRPSRAGLMAGLPASIAEPALAAAEEVARIAPRRRFDLVMGPLWDLEPAALIGRSPWSVAVSLHTSCAQVAAFKPEWSADYRQSHVDKVIAGERRLLAQARHVLANTTAAARDIGDALGLPDLAERAVVIPHGLPDLAQGVAPAAGRDEVEMLFVGRLELRKGIETLLSVAPSVLGAASNVLLTIVGEDVTAPGAEPWRERFLNLHAGAPWLERVRFEGPLRRSELLARYAACDVVLVPSHYESFGLTALEAMIFSKPCITCDVGGLSEVVVNGATGLLVKPGDAQALTAAMLRLTRSEELRRSMGAEGRRRYEAHFTASAMAQAAEDWIGAIVSHPQRFAAE